MKKLSILSLALIAGSNAVQAQPPLWVVSDADSSVYMLGTVHLLKEGMAPPFEIYPEVFARVEHLWLETDAVGDAARLAPILLREGYSEEKLSSTGLDALDIENLKEISAAYNIEFSMFEYARPWLVNVQISSLPLLDAGFHPSNGIDVMLAKWANDTDISISGFESPESQIKLLASMPNDVQISALGETIENFELIADQSVEQLEIWATGDLESLADTMALEKENQPAFFKSLFTDRNKLFADGVVDILQGQGVSLVAVGMGHFVGEDSILELLEGKGYTVTPVSPKILATYK